MKVMVVGSGGREQALAWKISRSPKVEKVFCVPGNGGTRPPAENVPIGALEIEKLRDWALAEKIGLVVIGPDDALALGAADVFSSAGIPCFGPKKNAARLESSKSFAKDFMLRHGIPCAKSRVFTDSDEARDYLLQAKYPLVVKADGLALGKGVVIAETPEEALAATGRMMDAKEFGSAGETVVIEEFLRGTECSIHAFIDGSSHLLCPDAKDHKRVGEGDEGPNTGGMGTISPSGAVDETMLARIREEVLDRFVCGLKKDGMDYRGMLFPGLMITENGPVVLEFNCRFGDPETQVLLRRLESDLVEILLATCEGRLAEISPTWSKNAAACIVMASAGYPGSYEKSLPIEGIDLAEASGDTVVFHAGTAWKNGELVTNGGRVLGVTATGETLEDARRKAYAAVNEIHFDGCFCRRDIGGGIL